MAAYYVWSGATGSGTGADWTNAKTSLKAAVAAGAAGDIYYVADDHAETHSGSDYELYMNGNLFNIDLVICVRRSGGSVPPVNADLRDTATITVTSAHQIRIGNGWHDIRGIQFIAGNGTVNGGIECLANYNSHRGIYRDCLFYINGTSDVNAGVGFTQSGFAELYDCQVRFSHTNNAVFGYKPILIVGGPTKKFIHPSGSIPGLPILVNPGVGNFIRFRAVDLSNVNTNLTYAAFGTGKASIYEKCLIDNSVSRGTNPQVELRLVQCTASGVNGMIDEISTYEGRLTTEQTIVRTAGATDGTYPFSWKVVTSANCAEKRTFETFEGFIWNDTTGSSKTLTVHIVTDNVTLKDNEIWLETWFMDTGAAPNEVTDGAGILATGTNQTSDSGEAWTTTGLTTPLKQKLEVTFTPQKKGWVRFVVKLAKPSTTVYVCPKADLV